jgi:UDP-glucose 4-epimerase
MRDYLYVSDVAEAFALALAYEGPHTVFNISSGKGVSLNDMIAMLARHVGREVVRDYRPGRPFDVPVSVLCNALAARELGWAPRVPLEHGLQKTVDWMRKGLPQ